MMRIVFVDDDVEVLNGLRRMLFARRTVWQLRFLSDPKGALDSLSDEPADLVVSDLQMPDMDGVAFLEQVRRRFPDTIRYVLTGVLDHPLLGRALRCAHHLIAKPCRPQQIIEAVERAEMIMLRLKKLKQASLLSGLDDLPVMPEVYQKVLNSLNSLSVSPRQLGQLITEDVGMSARIVQLANAPYFGRSGRIHDPIQAVVALGIKSVEAMILTEGLFARLDSDVVERFGLSALQSHCIRVGMLGRKIAMDLQCSVEQMEAASTAGILHDAGKIIWVSQMEDDFSRALRRSRSQRISLFEAEEALAGISHAELVGAMLQLWAMPIEIIEAVACHHCPSDAPRAPNEPSAPVLADIVCLADTIDHCFSSSRVDGTTPAVDRDRLRLLGLENMFQEWIQLHAQMQGKEAVYDCQFV